VEKKEEERKRRWRR
jgi:hypothetical protein